MTEDEVKAANDNPLCDRLDEINKIAAHALRLARYPAEMKQALEDIHALSGGFMKIPAVPSGERP
jgi:hypothetical protein